MTPAAQCATFQYLRPVSRGRCELSPPQVEVGTQIPRATALSATEASATPPKSLASPSGGDGSTGATDEAPANKEAQAAESSAEKYCKKFSSFVNSKDYLDCLKWRTQTEEAEEDKDTCKKHKGKKQDCCKEGCSYDSWERCVPKGEATGEDSCLRMKATFMDRDAVQGGLNEKEDFLEVGDKDSGSSAYVTPAQLASNQPYPGIDYLGAGYDIIHGAPRIRCLSPSLPRRSSLSICLHVL